MYTTRVQPGMPGAATSSGATSSGATPGAATPGASASVGFQDLLRKRLEQPEPVNFSRHAEERMKARQMELSTAEHGRLEQAVQRAAGKGSRESLVLLDRLAFVVHVPSRTVLTALPREQAREGVFTRIDSAVLA